jgi:hypothetical protein
MHRPAWILGGESQTAVLLAVALTISAAAGRVIEAIIIGVLLLPSFALVALWFIAWRRDQLADDA